MRRWAPLSTILALTLIAGCGATGDDPATPTETSTTEPAPTSNEETGDPAPQESEEETAADDNPDRFEGVQTNDFQRLPGELGPASRVAVETDPQEHTLTLEYEASEGTAKFLINGYFAATGPIEDTSDEGFQLAYSSAADTFSEQGARVEEWSGESDGFEWECVQAPGFQGDGAIDHTFCLTLAYGRALEVQALTLVEDDDDARWGNISDVLQELSGELADLPA